ncbi:MAG: gliding motility protein GldM [Paludibacteraceae bacterium]|nr:gliding motility protein GldM [Paludibacteraceae bacterium]
MIGMMYLVLTAMLALNVSAEIINGFRTVRGSMESSIASSKSRTEDVMANFEREYTKDEGGRQKYEEWYTIAKAIYSKSEEFYDYIEDFKLGIANNGRKESEKYERYAIPKKYDGDDDTNWPDHYAEMIDPATGRENQEELEFRMDDYRKYMTEADSECIKRKMSDAKFAHEWELKIAMFKELFRTDDEISQDNEVITWTQSIFHQMPAAAVLALLTKYQNDIRMAESEMVNFMFNAAGSSNFVVNTVIPVVVPQSSIILKPGEHYRARIVSGMVDTTQLPQVFVNGVECPDGIYDVAASGSGTRTFNGYILVPGDTTHYDFQGQYQVDNSSVAIANVDLNVMYIDYDNRFNISAPGVAGDKLRVDATNAKVSRGSTGEWIIHPNPGNAKKTTVHVRADKDGRVSEVGSAEFDLKPLPRPDAYVAIGDQIIEKDQIAKKYLISGQAGIRASYGADIMLKAKFTITSFAVQFPNGERVKCEGNKFNAKVISNIKGLSFGSQIVIRDVKATGPGGARTLRNVPIEVTK